MQEVMCQIAGATLAHPHPGHGAVQRAGAAAAAGGGQQDEGEVRGEGQADDQVAGAASSR